MATQTLEDIFGSRTDEDNAPPPAESLTFLAAQYLLLDKQVDEAMKQVAEMKSNRDRAELELLNAMESQKLKSFRLDCDGTLLTSVVKCQYALPNKSEPADRILALKWLKRIGARNLVEEGIHPSTLTAFLRERAEAKKTTSPLKEIIIEENGQRLRKMVSLIKETPLRSLSVRRE